MTHVERITLSIAAVFTVIALLKGPLSSYVPNCSDTSFGFCMERSRP